MNLNVVKTTKRGRMMMMTMTMILSFMGSHDIRVALTCKYYILFIRCCYLDCFLLLFHVSMCVCVCVLLHVMFAV